MKRSGLVLEARRKIPAGLVLFFAGAACLLAYLFFSRPAISQTPAPAVTQAEYLRRHVNFLTGLEPARNHANVGSLDRAADYIADKLRETGGAVRLQEFTVDGAGYKNVIASFPGQSRSRILIGAHYDVAGDQPGADDNASGVAVLLELAFLIKEGRAELPLLPHPVDLVAFSLEEPPYFRTEHMGSAIHAKSLAREKVDLEVMIALDCVGYYTDSPGSQNFPVPGMSFLYPDRGNFIGVIGKTGQGSLVKRVKRLLKRRIQFPVESITAPALLSGVDFSDHLNYWKHDYPALMISDTALYRNHNYHRPGDRPETLDYDKMSQLANGLYGLIVDWRGKKKSK